MNIEKILKLSLNKNFIIREEEIILNPKRDTKLVSQEFKDFNNKLNSSSKKIFNEEAIEYFNNSNKKVWNIFYIAQDIPYCEFKVRNALDFKYEDIKNLACDSNNSIRDVYIWNSITNEIYIFHHDNNFYYIK